MKSVNHLLNKFLFAFLIFAFHLTLPAQGILEDDFDPSSDLTYWSSIEGGEAATSCGAVLGNALYFNAVGNRAATTNPLNLSNAGNLTFYLKLAAGSTPCEKLDAADPVHLEYSTDNGSSWTIWQTFTTGNYANFTLFDLELPAAAATANTMIRWVQPDHSGGGYDNWAIDDVSIIANVPLDAGIASIELPNTICAGSTDIAATIANIGTDSIHEVTVHWSFDGVAETPINYTTPLNDASLISFASPVVPFASGNQPIQVVLKNNGLNDLTSLNFETEIKGVSISPYNWTGNLASEETDTVTVGTYNFLADSVFQVRVSSSNMNGTGDPFPQNDTLLVDSILSGMSGIYTIGGSNPDFTNFTEAVDALHNRGVADTVIFNVRDGDYNEQIELNEIAGTNATQPVIFQSESLDTNAVRLIANAGSDKNYVVYLNGCDWVSFQKMTFEPTNVFNSRIIVFGKNSFHNSIESCLLKGLPGDSDHLILSENVLSDSNSFLNNHFLHGDYGIYWDGVLSNGDYVKGLLVKGNHFDNQYRRGIYINDATELIITENEFTQTPIGIYFNDVSGGQITKNKIYNGISNTGIYCYNSNGSSTAPISLANNFVQVDGPANESKYGITIRACRFIELTNNTLRCSNPYYNSSPIFAYSSDRISLTNNILANTGGGYALKTYEAIDSSNYNNLYTTGTKLIEWPSVVYETLAEYQTGTGLDAQSVSTDPSFIGEDTYYATAFALDNKGKTSPTVLTDIDDNPRDSSSPDMGVVEFTASSENVDMIGFTKPTSPFAAGIQTVEIVFKNDGTNTLTNVNFDWEINGTNQTTVNWTGNLTSGAIDTLILGTPILTAGVNYNISATSSNPNGLTDAHPFNDTIEVNDLIASMSGIYTIGGVNPDFINFTEAVDALNLAGVSGPVTFNVRDSVYAEQIVLPEITGASEISPVVFQSESGDSIGVILIFSPISQSDNYTLKLDGADWVTFRKMTLQSTGPTYSQILRLQNGANHNLFENIYFAGVQTTGTNTSYKALVTTANSIDEYNVFQNNYFEFGTYGLYIIGNVPHETGNQILNNHFVDQFSYSVHLTRLAAPEIIGNSFSNTNPSNIYIGIRCYENSGRQKILNNKFNLTNSNAAIFIDETDGTDTERGLIANNIISMTSAGIANGISIDNSSYQEFYHNSINVHSPSTVAAAARVTYCSHLFWQNNIYVNTAGGWAFYTNQTNSLDISDHNNFYTTGTTLIHRNPIDYPDLASWQAATNYDDHSVVVDPEFNSTTNLRPSNAVLDNKGTPIDFITTDFDSIIRNSFTPDIGAYEFSSIADDAGIASIDEPTSSFTAGVHSIQVTLFNNGNDTLKNITIQWEINNILQAPFNWTGQLTTGQTRDSIEIGTYHFTLDTTFSVRAWTELPNGNTDSYPLNDTAFVSGLHAGLAGPYTIGGASPDFISFTDAVQTLIKGGVLGAVVFSVRDGVYEERVTIPEIAGVDSLNTVTFQSESGDSSTVSLQYESLALATDFVLYLDGADYFRFKNLTIKNIGQAHSSVINLINGANYNEFSNNHILSQNVAFNVFANQITSRDGQNDFNVFKNNFFKGANHGIYFFNTNTIPTGRGTIIEGNHFEDHSWSSIYQYRQTDLSINNNTITNSKIGTGFKAIELVFCYNNFTVNNNRIYNISLGHGIELRNCSGSTNNSIVANNMIALENITSANAAMIGLNLVSCSSIGVYHNSISNNSVATYSNSIQLEESNGIELLNNIFNCSNKGFIIDVFNSTYNSDYNDFYVGAGNIGRWDYTPANDLAAWQTLSNQEANSLNVDPFFVSVNDLHTTQILLNAAATSLPFITTDFDGEMRDTLTPDIGADERIFIADDIGVIALTNPESACELSDSNHLTITIQNYSETPQTNFEVAYILDGRPPVIENVGGLTVPSGSEAKYTFNATEDFSAFADYSITAYTALAIDSIFSNDTLAFILTNAAIPNPITNMLPTDGSVGVSNTVPFSWSPSAGATRYDLFVWRDTAAMPSSPSVSDITQINHSFSSSIIDYGATYNWQLIAKNDYCETPGPIQTFTIRNLSDIVVDSVQAPTVAFSSQPISVTYEVKNIGSSSTGGSQWRDYFFLSDDVVLDLNTDLQLGFVQNFSALAAGESYANSATFNLPQGLSGTYHIFVWTDRFNNLLEDNNSNNTGINNVTTITLTPPPDLRVTSVLSPNNAFSGTNINVSWSVENKGTGKTTSGSWHDRVFLSTDSLLNMGTATLLGQKKFTGVLEVDSSYAQGLTGTLPNGISGTYFVHVITDFFQNEYEHASENNNTGTSTSMNIILTPPPDLVVTEIMVTDSVSNNENITLQWTVENQGGTATSGSWKDDIYISPNPNDTSLIDAIYLGKTTRPTNLNPIQIYTSSRTVTIPDGIHGPHYFYVVADGNDDLFEYTFNKNNQSRSVDSTEIHHAELALLEVNAPITAMSGDTILVNWLVENIGTGQVLNQLWKDKIFLSHSSTFHPDSVVQIGATNSNVNLLANDSLEKELILTLPNGLDGSFYLYVQVDADSTVYENNLHVNNTNGTGNPLYISLSPYVDLKPTDIAVIDSTSAGSSIPVAYTVHNSGNGDAIGLSWKDRFYLSDSLNFDSTTARRLSAFPITHILGVDSVYEENVMLELPANLPTGEYFLFIKTDDEHDVYEHTEEGNNFLGSDTIFINGYPSVDLAVTVATAPDSAFSGKTINVEWSVQNLASVATIAPQWKDAVYLSADSILDVSTDKLLGSRNQVGLLAADETYSQNGDFTIPNGLQGDYYLFVKTDDEAANNDSNLANNEQVASDTLGTPGIHIELTPPSDLVVTSFVVPANGLSGQPLQLIWTVQNNGVGPTDNNWSDRFFISTDFDLDNNDVAIGTKNHVGILEVGESYTDTVDFNIPINISGNRILIIKTDNGNIVYEHFNENNNTATGAISIVLPPPSDLVVSNVVVPSDAIAGEEILVEWTLENKGINPANGSMKEAVYLSTDPVWDVNDALLGTFNSQINLVPGAAQNRSISADLTNVVVADYYAIVRTDILNNIYESDDTNNQAVSDLTVNINTKLLLLDVLTPDTLLDNRELYYRIEIPDSLEGESLLVRLKGDSISGNNNLYFRYGDVPNLVAYDQVSSTPFFGNQAVIEPSLQKGTNYLMVYGNTAMGNEQPITLLASILNFEIRSVHSKRGGNQGKVTVEVNGSKFDETMVVKLANETDTITAGGVMATDPIKAYATFDLKGRPLGMYDVLAVKQNGEIAILQNGFEVVAALPVNLATNILIPANTRPGRTVSIQVEYANNGNMNIPNPIATLISVADAPIALSALFLDAGDTELLLPLEESGAPSGVLRPGGAGSITIYARADAGLGFMLKPPDFD